MDQSSRAKWLIYIGGLPRLGHGSEFEGKVPVLHWLFARLGHGSEFEGKVADMHWLFAPIRSWTRVRGHSA